MGKLVYALKCADNEYERKFYSLQNKMPLFSPFTINTTNGHAPGMPGHMLYTLKNKTKDTLKTNPKTQKK